MPVGFYYRAFFRPGKIWERFWEPIVRAKAGLGESARHLEPLKEVRPFARALL